MKKTNLLDKIKSLDDAKTRVDALKASGKKIVFTNGCFDILHAGHVMYLDEAKALGDVLVLGLNSDSSIQQLKGSHRPVVKEKERQLVMAALESIDFVILFQETTPFTLIETLKPDIHVKGGDYKADQLPEYPIVKSYGGDVQILPFYPGMSTTSIINTILETYTNDPA